MAEKTLQGSNQNLVKRHNLRVVLLNLLNDPGVSRVQLAKRTNLSNTTITNLISELIQQGIIIEEENSNNNVKEILRPVGRPQTGLRLDPNARYAVGIHIGVGTFRVGLVNLFDEIIANQRESFNINAPSNQVLDQIAEVVNTFLAESGEDLSRIVGVGIGASGLVEASTGVNLIAPNLNWRNVALKAHFEKALGLPVFVDNNVRAMAIAETYFGAGKGVDSLAFVYGRIGVGAGLISRGQPFRGSVSGAGEIGHTIMLINGGEPCRCGNNGCLETLISEQAILKRAEIIMRTNPGGVLAQIQSEYTDQSPVEMVFMAARKGDMQVLKMLEERVNYLGIALANLINLFNPQVILLGGIFASGSDLLIPTLKKTIQETAFGGMGKNVQVEPTSFGWKAGVAGASALALLHFFYQQNDDCISW